MPKGDKYSELKKYLVAAKEPVIKLTFSQVETIIYNSLPASATNHAEAWWSNNYDHSQAIAWLDAGYQTDYVSDTYQNEEIVFVKRR